MLDLLLIIPLLLKSIGDSILYLFKHIYRPILSKIKSLQAYQATLTTDKHKKKTKKTHPSKKKPTTLQVSLKNLLTSLRLAARRSRGSASPRPRHQKRKKLKLPKFLTTPIYLRTKLSPSRWLKKRAYRKKIISKTIYRAPFSVRHARIAVLLSFILGSILTLVFIIAPFIGYQWILSLPSPYLLAARDVDVTTKIYDRNGILLYEIYADQNRTPIPLDDIPEIVTYATISIEDKDFFNHQGFSISGILRAAQETLIHGNLQGGSTITQQLIKSTLLTPEVKISRKIKEVVLAFWAEHIFTKDQILEMYLNQVPYGGTAWGIEAASQAYFGVSVGDLSLAQAALLAGLPAAPTSYSPFTGNIDKAIDRQKEVLRRMYEDGHISYQQMTLAMEEPLRLLQPTTPIKAPHFVLYVKQLLEERYGTRLVERGGLRVTTSLDFTIQEEVQSIVTDHVKELSELQVGNGAAIVMNPTSGEILAMVGSADYFDTENEGNVNVTTQLRQPGSSIKVVTYAAALENDFTAATILQDTPVTYDIPGSEPYTPVNYDSRFHGPTPLRYALGNSYNIPAVRVLEHIGVQTMISTAKKMGIHSWNREGEYGLALTLGAAEASVIEMASVYSTLANKGIHNPPIPVLEVTDYTGQILERAQPSRGIRALSEETSWIISHILSDNVARTAAFGPNSLLVIPEKTVSVKTGTSNDKRDNWAIGYTPSVVAAVWVGNNDNSPMHPVLSSGITGATPIWRDIMLYLLSEKPNEIPEKPDTVLEIPCYFGRVEYFTQGTEPAGGRCTRLPTPTRRSAPSPSQEE